jgi:WD40 repeat protein
VLSIINATIFIFISYLLTITPLVAASNDEINQLLQTCERHFRAHRLTTGKEGTALVCYQEVLAKEPGNVQALAGLKKIEEQYVQWTTGLLKKGQLKKARQYLSRLRLVNPNSSALRALEMQLENVVQLPHQIIQTIKGHKKAVLSVAMSPDSKYLVTGSEDKTIKLWEISSGEVVYDWLSEGDSVFSVDFQPNGKEVVAASYRTIQRWTVEGGQPLPDLSEEHRGTVYTVAYSQDGNTLASGSGDNSVKLWEASTGKRLQTLYGHQWAVRAVTFSPDGNILASASSDNTVKLWRVKTGHLIHTLEGHREWAQAVAFSPDGKRLATGSRDNTIKLWQVDTGRLIRTLESHINDINNLVFMPDGLILISASDDHTIKFWEVNNGQLLNSLKGHRHAVTAIAISPDGRTLVSASRDQTIKLWQ